MEGKSVEDELVYAYETTKSHKRNFPFVAFSLRLSVFARDNPTA